MPFIAFLLLSCWSILFSLLTSLFVEPFSDGVATSLKICSFGVRTRLQKDWNPILSGHLRPLQAAIFTSTAAADGQNIWGILLQFRQKSRIEQWENPTSIISWYHGLSSCWESVVQSPLDKSISILDLRQVELQRPLKTRQLVSKYPKWTVLTGKMMAKWWQNALRAKEALESAWNCLHHKEPTACFRNGTSNNFMRICWELRSCNICGHVPI